MINNKLDEVIENFLNHSKIDIKIIKYGWKVTSLSSIMFIHCVINVIK